MFHYYVYFTQDEKRRVVDCAGSISIANAVARKYVVENATDVVISVVWDAAAAPTESN